MYVHVLTYNMYVRTYNIYTGLMISIEKCFQTLILENIDEKYISRFFYRKVAILHGRAFVNFDRIFVLCLAVIISLI